MVGLAREKGVLVLAVTDAEKQKPRESGRCRGARFAHHLGDRESLEPGCVFDLLAVLDRAPHDHRENDSTGEVRARKRSRPHRVLCESPSRERGLSHDPMVRTIADQAVAKGYHFSR